MCVVQCQVSFGWAKANLATTLMWVVPVEWVSLYLRLHDVKLCYSYSGANIYAEDQSLCTPVLTAAAYNKVEAFHCLMQFIDLIGVGRKFEV